MSDEYLFAYHIMFLYNCHLHDSFEFWFLLWSLNAVDLEVLVEGKKEARNGNRMNEGCLANGQQFILGWDTG